ncbi:hypothetical protein GH714_034253 [Hevea brasiliensis]|uniref:Ferredoxin thioredoxin reductase alpha chain domain-containing protein n=1 Tax=Hevea brasiliensis TaxID=3981 RepID=A0A6A6MJM9_HEVBR|nr:hypothetical protein GH714_034253 [Hevea brasiliensis]
MSPTTLALPSAGGAASACSPLNRPTAPISSALRCVDITANATMMLSKKSLVSPSSSSSSSSSISSAVVAAACTNVDNGSMMMICSIKAIRRPSLSSSSTTVTQGEEEGEETDKKIGARVRVKVPLKVYHVPRVPEVDLTGKEGHLKQYVALWKGKRISANLPYKVEFVVDIEGRGPVKFFAHLKEDEFDYLE